jgi:hypothetical protein
MLEGISAGIRGSMLGGNFGDVPGSMCKFRQGKGIAWEWFWMINAGGGKKLE